MPNTPTELRLSADKRTLSITFADGQMHDLSAEYLRVESPSAEIKGHGGGPKKIVGGKKDVTIAAIQPSGNYAVILFFSDGHNTGIYTWDYLHELATTHAEKWQTYLTNVFKLGLEREPKQVA